MVFYMIKVKTCHGDYILVKIDSIIKLQSYGDKCKVFTQNDPFYFIANNSLDEIQKKILQILENKT